MEQSVFFRPQHTQCLPRAEGGLEVPPRATPIPLHGKTSVSRNGFKDIKN